MELTSGGDGTCGVAELYNFEEDLFPTARHIRYDPSCGKQDAFGDCQHPASLKDLTAAVKLAMREAKATVIATLTAKQVKRMEPALFANGFTFQGTARNPNTGNKLRVYVWVRPTRIRNRKNEVSCR